IRLTVSGQLTLDGLLSANGGAGLQDDSGGGSGGSIYVTAGKLLGSGNISANGGSGGLYGGGRRGRGRHGPFLPGNHSTRRGFVAEGARGGSEGGTAQFSLLRQRGGWPLFPKTRLASCPAP